MPIETGRRRHSLKIPVPDNEELAFYIWITDEITFVRQDGIGQEIRLTMQNGQGQSTRDVSIKKIEVDNSDPIEVEVISGAQHKEDQGIGQEAVWSFLNDPPTHLRTHEVKIKARDQDGVEDENNTLTLEKLEQFYVKDASGIGQEGYWTLENQDDESQINFANPDDVYNKDNGPIRLDWFQNITDAEISVYTAIIEIRNSNSITDDIYDVYVNGKFVITCDFSPNNEDTSFVVKIGIPGESVLPLGTVRGEKKYDTWAKSPYTLGVNSVEFRNMAQNNNGNFFIMDTIVFNAKGEQVFNNRVEMSGYDGDSFTRTVDLSSLKSSAP